MKRKSKKIINEYGKFTVYERSQQDDDNFNIAAESGKLSLTDQSLIIIRDGLKYNIKWFNPFSWLKVFSCNFVSLKKMPSRLILILAKNICELEGKDVSNFKFLLKEMTAEEEAEYTKMIKKKVENYPNQE
jgi:hypothetical protein